MANRESTLTRAADNVARLTRETEQYGLFLLLMGHDGGSEALLSKLDDFMERTEDTRTRLQARAIRHCIKYDKPGNLISWTTMVYREMKGEVS